MFQCPREHAAALKEVKRTVGINHSYLDGWIYLFLANKKFDVAETVAKLERRDDMERTVFAKYTMTDSLRKSMRAGIVQYIGRDKEGHSVLYFNTARDSPKAEQRPERQANMDMFLSWCVRCHRKNPTAMVTWLINQENASMLRNTDLIFQKEMALRISKFFPGVVSRMFICNMSSALTFVVKPLLRQLPKTISDCIFLLSASDIRKGELLKRIDANVLPLEMGGRNDCDHPPNYERFATTIESYFDRCIRALNKGISIKEMEVMEEFGVDKDGAPVALAGDGAAAGYGSPTYLSNGSAVMRHAEAYRGMSTFRSAMPTTASEEMLDFAIMQDPCAVSVDAERRRITVQSAVRPDREGLPLTSPTSDTTAIACNTSFASLPTAPPSLLNHVSSSEFFECVSEPGESMEDFPDATITREGLYCVHLNSIEEFSYSAVLRKAFAQGQGGGGAIAEQQDACLRDWISFRCRCVELMPKLEHFLEALRLGALLPADERELTTQLRRCSHFMLNLFPQTRQTLPFPLLDWYAAGPTARHRSADAAAASYTGKKEAAFHTVVDPFAVNPRRLAFRLDCTSPDNVLLSAQAGAIEFVENWDDLIAVDERKKRVVRRLLLTWPPQTDRCTFEEQLHVRARQLWAQLTPLFRAYIEAKVGISIAEFIQHYGLLVPGGRIDETAEWYRLLFSAVLQYRELHRRNWLFYVFPPPRHAGTRADEPPTMERLLQARGDTGADVQAVISLMTLVEQSLRYTTDQLRTNGAGGAVATRTIVERYIEASKAKVYIPYDTQRSGVLPSESIAQYKLAAATCLKNVEAPLQEFLFTMVSLTVLKQEYPPDMTKGEIMSGLQLAKTESEAHIQERRQHQRVAISFARICSELQGSFGHDIHNLLPIYSAAGMQADGYALGLELLLAVAILRCGRDSDGSSGLDGASSSTPADIMPAATAFSEDDSSTGGVDAAVRDAAAPPSLDVESLRETLNEMSHPASRLASLKRMYIF
ncbi:hypothetical protein LMJF_31_0360 [Leishmania major strain Friedlin]|uniref:Uncharacterized protein n=1 Tax=Leishmania major TaxID=5664 RepID=Q4Q6M7_LEIMA|nr:hypothetical protein LMJF_31_0360 [Leishmania major strain Friedlin]CAG9579187.1 CRAL/TRIO_domain_containing_protein_-_putative [Leishmania major strain Friedlin]CAJ08223.1 hypothetical protein LMJF_31_0360 [Leishmania major strain Friedlin]|eukprot:XP_001685021.1 hypothetical protein LMJF_31_0360 [Leishmania major strain Friedlin]